MPADGLGVGFAGIGVPSPHVHIAEVPDVVHGFPGGQLVGGITGTGVGGGINEHTADLGLGVDTAAGLHGQGAGHQHVVADLQFHVGGVLVGAVDDARLQPGPVQTQGAVDLVEGHPVFDPALVALKQHRGVPLKESDELAVAPAAVLLHQGQGHLVVADGHHRHDVVFFQLVQYLVVEGQARLVGLGLVPPGEDARPGNGEAEALEAHLSQQSDVLFIMVVEIHAVVAGVVVPGVHAVVDHPLYRGAAALVHVVDGNALAALLPGTLKLVGGGGAAPQKVRFQHRCLPSFPALVRWFMYPL